MEESEIKRILSCFRNGETSADECFCLVLSLKGYEAMRFSFLSQIDSLKLTNPQKYTELYNIYVTYFSQCPSFDFTDPIECSVENGLMSSDFGYELDMEMALSNSLEDKLSVNDFKSCAQRNLGDNQLNTYASCLTRAQQPSSSIQHPYQRHPDLVSTSCKEIPSANTHKLVETVPIENITIPGLLTTNDQVSHSKKKRKKIGKKNVLGSVSAGLSNKPVVYWIRRDLRIYDNPALVAAAELNAPVIIIFLWSEKEEDPHNDVAAGGATKLWLHYALKELNASLLDKYGNGIIFRKTLNCQSELKRIFAETGSTTLVMNDVYEPFLKARDDKICNNLERRGITCKRFESYLLYEPGSVSTDSLGMKGVGSVGHFMECCRRSSTQSIGQPLDAPSLIPRPNNKLSSMELDELELARMPRRKDGTVINWAAPIVKSWDFSEDGAWEALSHFLEEGIKSYEKESGRADHLNTCKISPYLHFGQISPRSVLTEARHMKSPKFLRKLAWRDMSYWLLTLWPNLPSVPTRVHYRDQRWSDNKAHLKAWQKGYTGFPLVDASMRQLWLTGWMNNYMRHVVASFLISYLNIHWVEGYKWFQDTLLDADVAINAMMWQNGGMSGLDQWNFVMHPVDAAMTCDPEGNFVRQWCPELARMPNDFIHQPWKCPPSVMKRCGVELGATYPHRIITKLEDAREQSLKDVVDIRMSNPRYVCRRTGNDLVPMPNGKLVPVITRREFKYKTENPEAEDNPHTAVLRGYRSRKRDEAIAFANQVDFLSSTMNEIVQRQDRHVRNAKHEVF